MTLSKTFATTAIVMLPLLATPNAFAASTAPNNHPNIVVDDELKKLNTSSLQSSANQLNDKLTSDNKSPVNIIYVLSDNPSLTKDNYNTDIRAYTGSLVKSGKIPSSDVTDSNAPNIALANNTILMAISPKVRQVGVYTKDQSELDTFGGAESITDAAKPEAREANWTSAFTDMTDFEKNNLNSNLNSSKNSQASNKDSNESNTVMTIAAWFMLVGVLGAVGLAIYNSKRDNKKKSDNSDYSNSSANSPRGNYTSERSRNYYNDPSLTQAYLFSEMNNSSSSHHHSSSSSSSDSSSSSSFSSFDSSSSSGGGGFDGGSSGF